MTRIAVVADSHADEHNNLAEHDEVMAWIADEAARRGCSLMLHAGDVYERTSEPTERISVANWIRQVAELAPLVVCAGNHDQLLDIEHIGRLAGVTCSPIACTRPGVIRVAECAVAVLPWPRKAHFLAGVESTEASSAYAQEQLRILLLGLRDQLAEFELPRILLAHVMIDGARTDHSQPLVGQDMNVSLADLASSRADFVACGHVHAQQEWEFDGVPISYVGAPRHTNFGEIGPRGFLVLEFKGRKLVGCERVVTPSAPLVLLESAWTPGVGFPLSLTNRIPESEGAKVRVRYQVAREHRDVAAAAAAIIEQQILAAGALTVKIEAELVIETTARAPEITAAKTLTEKLEHRWRIRGYDPGDRREPLLTKVRKFEHVLEQGNARTAAAVRLESVHLRNIGVIRDFTLDLTAFGDARLIAVTGANGQGKSTLLECSLPGALHRDTPTHGRIGTLARAADSLIEVSILNGRRIKLRHLLNGINGKGESIALDEEGHDLTGAKSGKRRDFSRWAAENLPSPEELMNTAFCAQADHGFIGMTDGERKAVILRVLGIERYEGLAKTARDNAGVARTDLATVAARIADEEKRGGDIATAQVALEEAQQAAGTAERGLACARKALADAQFGSAEAKRLAGEYAVTREKRADLAKRLKEATTRHADLETRLANNQAVLAEGDAIRAAVVELARLQAEATRIQSDLTAVRAEVDRLTKEIASLTTQRTAAETRTDRANARLADRTKIEDATARLPDETLAEDIAHRKLEDVQYALDALRGQHVAGMGERIAGLRAGLGTIKLGQVGDPREIASRTLDADDTDHRRAQEVPREVTGLEKALADAKRLHSNAQQTTAATRQFTARLPEIQAAERDLTEARAEMAHLDLKVNRLKDDRAATEVRARNLDVSHREIARQIAQTEPTASKADALTRAETRIAELEPQEQAARSELESLAAEIEATPEPSPDPIAPDVAAPQKAVSEAEKTAREKTSAIAVAEHELEAAQASASQVERLQIEQRATEAELGDWNRLTEDLGRDGLQADEIDAAGPGITADANDLLHTCHGPRWTIEVRTTRDSADGKRELEGCEIMVTDMQEGRVGEARTYSGGEKVILGEALSLSLAMLGCRRAQVEGPTLVRDESGASLDPENAPAYVKMMRRAADFIKADRVLFVSHSPLVIELADARVEMPPTLGQQSAKAA
jgi:DNA repair exonuclease SbcCD ATPase subunit/DNA repair exonuclease SbcCD nuclease subunit